MKMSWCIGAMMRRRGKAGHGAVSLGETLMASAGSVRDCDIAMESLRDSGVKAAGTLRQLAANRHKAAQELSAELRISIVIATPKCGAGR